MKFKAYLKKIEIESNTVYQVFYTDGEINKDITEGCRKILEEYMGEEFAKKHTPEFPAYVFGSFGRLKSMRNG